MDQLMDLRFFIRDLLQKDSEDENEEKRRDYESQIIEISSSIKKYKSMYEDSILSLEKIKKKYAESKYEMNNLQNKCNIWNNMKQRMTTAYNQDVKRLENLKESSQKNKIDFCNRAQNFIKNFGVAAMEQNILYLNAQKQISDITPIVKTDVPNAEEVEKLDDLENMSVEQLKHILQSLTINIAESENYFHNDDELQRLRHRIKCVNEEIQDLQRKLTSKRTNNEQIKGDYKSNSNNNKFILKDQKQQPITNFLKKCKQASGNIIINQSTYKIVEVLDSSNFDEKLVINEKTSHLIPCGAKDIEAMKNKGSRVEETTMSKPRFKMNKRKKGNFSSKIMYGRK